MTDLSQSVRNEFPKKKIVIAGDVVADQFLRGTISRVSREAPVFILRHDETETVPGGAANAAVNAATLGADPVLVGIVGRDVSGEALLERLRSAGVNCEEICSPQGFKTTTKVRVLASQHYAARQQVIRIDYENDPQLAASCAAELESGLIKACGNADAIIVSDYNYGVVTASLVDAARRISVEKGIPLIIDSRFRLRNFPNATSATPNQEEVEQILGAGFTADQCEKLRAELGYEALLVTRGNQGMTLFEKGRTAFDIGVVGSAEPVDVTGAGDTVIAVYALALASGFTYAEAANAANHAGALVVMKKGTASITLDELADSITASGSRSA
jgi:rfaE bifunctional protein kinase chain/domain